MATQNAAMRWIALAVLLLLAASPAQPSDAAAPLQHQPWEPPLQATSPPRGWNSYDAFTWRVTEAEFLANCQYVADHLLQHGFEYCVVDYLWFMDLNATAVDGSPWTPGEAVAPGSLHVDAHGRPLPAPDRWPSAAGGAGFAPVAAKVKAMGLKFGVHVMRGVLSAAVAQHSPVLGTPATADQIAMASLSPSKDGPGRCPWYPGAISVDVTKAAGRAFYDSQYALFKSWGVRFVKNDCVFGNYVPLEIKAQSASIAKATSQAGGGGDSIVYSLSPGVSDAAKAKEIGPFVNMYRLTGDVWDSFSEGAALQDIEFVTSTGLSGHSGLGAPGSRSFPDMDMLPFGYICSQNAAQCPDHISRMPRRTQQTVLAVWAMAGSPIFFDGDCRKMDPQTLALLTMDEVLAVNSAATNRTQLFARLDGGIRTGGAFSAQSTTDPATRYVLLLHPPGDDYPPPLPEMTVEWGHFGLPAGSTCAVRDLFSGSSLGEFRGNFTTAINDSFVLVAVSGCSSGGGGGSATLKLDDDEQTAANHWWCYPHSLYHMLVLVFQPVAEGSAAAAVGTVSTEVSAVPPHQIDMSRLAALDIDPALKQFIKTMVIELREVKNENVVLQNRTQVVEAQLEQVTKDKDALENKTEVIEMALRQEIAGLQMALHNIFNKTTTDMVLLKGDVWKITVRLDQCEAETTPFIKLMERRRTQDEETLCRGSGLTAMFGACCPN